MSFDRRNANPLSCHLLYLGLKRGFVSVFCFECMIIMQTRPSSATWHSVLRSKAHLLCNHKPISPWRRWTRHGIMQYTTMSKKKKRVLRRTSFPKCRAMHAFVPRIPKDFPPRRRFPINNFFCCGQEFFFPLLFGFPLPPLFPGRVTTEFLLAVSNLFNAHCWGCGGGGKATTTSMGSVFHVSPRKQTKNKPPFPP